MCDDLVKSCWVENVYLSDNSYRLWSVSACGLVNKYRNLKKSSAFICRITRSKESELLGLRDAEEVTTAFPRNVGNSLPVDMA